MFLKFLSNKFHQKQKGSVLILGAIIILAFIALFAIVAGVGLMAELTGPGSGGTGTAGILSCTTGQISTNDKNQIERNLSVYQQAADKTNVPWEFLVAIHYRETSLRTNDSNPFQITNNKVSGFSVDSATEAAEKAKSLVKSVYNKTLTKNSDAETIKLSLLAYNRGAMYKQGGCSWNESPYVMNQFDAAHKDMRWPNNSCEPPSVRDLGDSKLGGFTFYTILKGCSSRISGKAALPLDPTKIKRYNNTPHGQSITHPGYLQFHNVFLGPGSYGSNIPSGLGEAVDLYTAGGLPVYSPFDGQVIFSSRPDSLCGGGCGGFIIVQSLDRKSVAALAHLQNFSSKGTFVQAGQKVGEIYAYSGSHLHFELWINGSLVHAGALTSTWKSEKVWEAQKRALGF